LGKKTQLHNLFDFGLIHVSKKQSVKLDPSSHIILFPFLLTLFSNQGVVLHHMKETCFPLHVSLISSGFSTMDYSISISRW